MKKLAGILALLFAVAVQAADVEQIKATLQKIDPRIPIVSVEPAQLPGFQAVTLGTGEVIYASDDAQYFMAGNLFQYHEGKGFENLTEVRLKGLRVSQMRGVADQDMVIYPAQGERKARVLVFTDIDCPYCQKLHLEVPALNEMGVEVAYLAYPRSGLNGSTAKRMAEIWCQQAEGRLEAMDRAVQGQSNPATECETPIAEQFALGQRVGVTGTPALVLEDGTLLPGYMPSDRLAQVLGLN